MNPDNEPPKPNAELLRKVLTHIQQNPETWNQDFWAEQVLDKRRDVCGTVYCFAGHTCSLALKEDFKAIFENDHLTVICSVPDLPEFEDLAKTKRGFLFIPDVARKLLGLTEKQAKDLFDMNNSLSALERIVAEIITGVR